LLHVADCPVLVVPPMGAALQDRESRQETTKAAS